jgi:hypothetical protein
MTTNPCCSASVVPAHVPEESRASLQFTWLGRGTEKTAANELGRVVCSAVTPGTKTSRPCSSTNALFDAKTETVTFLNEKPEGTRTTLPMGRPEFAPFVGSFMRLCAEVFGVLADEPERERGLSS